MYHRHWFLIAAAALVFWHFVSRYIPKWTPISEDPYFTAAIAIGCAAAYVAFEVAYQHAVGRPLTCRCGYRLHGLRCPECGEPLGGVGERGQPKP